MQAPRERGNTLALDGVSGRVKPRPRFTPGTHWTGGWVGTRAGLYTEARGKILCLCRGSNLGCPVVQSVVRHYTEWATAAPLITVCSREFKYSSSPQCSLSWESLLYIIHSNNMPAHLIKQLTCCSYWCRFVSGESRWWGDRLLELAEER
jgi:hypothetical protein